MKHILLLCCVLFAATFAEGFSIFNHAKEEPTFDVYGFDTPEQALLHDQLTSKLLNGAPFPKSYDTFMQTNVNELHQSTFRPVVSAGDVALSTQSKAQYKRTRWHVMSHDTGTKYRGEWFSQENGGKSRLFPYPIFGMRCRGNFCDDKQPMYTMPLRTPLHNGVKFWTEYATKDKEYHGIKGAVHCPRGMFVVQMQCQGYTCNRIKLGCSTLRYGFRARYKLTNYEKTHGGKDVLNPTFSEEGTGEGLCPEGEYMDGIQCSGFWCDNVRLFCTTINIAVWK